MKKISKTSLLLFFMALASRVYAQDCGSSFYPMKTGTVMILEHKDAKGKTVGKNTQVFKAVQNTANGIKADIENEFTDNKGKSNGKYNYNMSCENGVFKINMRDMMPTSSMMPPGSGNMRMEITGDNMDLPSNLKAGQKLGGGSMAMKSYMGEVKLMEMNFTIRERNVEGTESVTVPAGTFTCYKVTSVMDYDMMGKKRTSKSSVWYANGAGMVKQESYDESGKVASSSILVELRK